MNQHITDATRAQWARTDDALRKAWMKEARGASVSLRGDTTDRARRWASQIANLLDDGRERTSEDIARALGIKTDQAQRGAELLVSQGLVASTQFKGLNLYRASGQASPIPRAEPRKTLAEIVLEHMKPGAWYSAQDMFEALGGKHPLQNIPRAFGGLMSAGKVENRAGRWNERKEWRKL